MELKPKNIVNEFYEKINNSIESEETFKLWSVQRNSINEIITRIKNESGDFKKIAVLGAGNCNDIDLGFLSHICEEITLFDIDSNALEEGIKKYVIESNCKIKLAGDVEFTGLREANFYNMLKQKLHNGVSVKELAKFIRKEVLKLNNDTLIKQFKNNFDFVISMPVHTQLSYPLCASILSEFIMNYEDNEVNNLLDEFNYLAIESSKQYNEFIYQIGSESARYLILTDVMEFTEKTRKLEALAQFFIMQNDYKGLYSLTTKYYKISGSLEGLEDFRHKRVELQAMNFWIWPFINERSYLIFGLRAMKKQ